MGKRMFDIEYMDKKRMDDAIAVVKRLIFLAEEDGIPFNVFCDAVMLLFAHNLSLISNRESDVLLRNFVNNVNRIRKVVKDEEHEEQERS